MIKLPWKILEERFKKRKGWIAVGNTFIITGFLSFSNHPDWGVWCSVIGLAVTGVSILKK